MIDGRDAHTAMMSLKGKRALVTGGTTGIGRAIANLLASEGARVFVCGRDEGHLADALERLNELGANGGGADGMAIDLAEPDAPAKFVAAGKEKLGGVDIVVANAAGAAEGLTDTSADELRYAIAVNLGAYMLTAHAAAEAMTEGDIILIGSTSAHVLGPGSTVYAATKSGIAGFAEALRKELGPKGVRVSLIEPGLTGSDMIEKSPEEKLEAIAQEKMLRAEDIAVAAHFALTQPRRAVVQQITMVPRGEGSE